MWLSWKQEAWKAHHASGLGRCNMGGWCPVCVPQPCPSGQGQAWTGPVGACYLSKSAFLSISHGGSEAAMSQGPWMWHETEAGPYKWT